MTAVTTGLQPAQVQALIISKLLAHRNALVDVQNLFKWASGLAVADLATAAGLSTADAQPYLAAMADANAEAQTHFTGLPPNTYPQPGSAYIYAASQAQVTGPQ